MPQTHQSPRLTISYTEVIDDNGAYLFEISGDCENVPLHDKIELRLSGEPDWRINSEIVCARSRMRGIVLNKLGLGVLDT